MKSESNDEKAEAIRIVADMPTDDAIIACLEAGRGIVMPAPPVYTLPALSADDAGISCSYQLDVDELLRIAVRNNDADRSMSIDYGTAYFCDNGSLVLECSLPCNNMFYTLIDGNDPVDICDKAMSVLENIKNTVSKMQEKVFELSLSQKVKDN